jgi:hypothetical protein
MPCAIIQPHISEVIQKYKAVFATIFKIDVASEIEHHSIASEGYHSVRSLTVLVYTV